MHSQLQRFAPSYEYTERGVENTYLYIHDELQTKQANTKRNRREKLQGLLSMSSSSLLALIMILTSQQNVYTCKTLDRVATNTNPTRSIGIDQAGV